MMVYTIGQYIFIYVCWCMYTATINNNAPNLSVAEHMYVKFSDACKALAALHTITEDDEKELQNTMLILHIKKEMVMWYPINVNIVPKDHIILKWYLINGTLERSDTQNGSIFTVRNDSKVYWLPLNASLVKLDDKMTKWIPIVINRTSEQKQQNFTEPYPIDESQIQLDDNIFQWFALNNTLEGIKNIYNEYKILTFIQQMEKDMVKWYPINDSLVRLDDDKLTWSPKEDSLHRQQIKRYQTRRTREDAEEGAITINWHPINESFVALKRPDIDINLKTKVIIHGYLATALNKVTFLLADAFYKEKQYNILLIDAEAMFSKLYFKSVNNVRLVGKAIADMIIHLEGFGADAKDFHLLGVSLGAHVAGWAGKYYRNYKGRSIGRITGLDPAGPCFSYVSKHERLDKSDALFVDVIHTNILMQGTFERLGHADFYVNGGGPFQPGCVLFHPDCSHLRAAHVYTESIKQPGLFIAVKCASRWHFMTGQCENSTSPLGYGTSPSTRGVYYIRTSDRSPYGLEINGIRPE